MDQRRAVERARQGDHDAFAELATAAFGRVSAIAQLIVRDHELARDTVQDAFLRAWRDLPGLRDPDRFDAWLHRLVVRTCINALRSRRRRPTEVEIGSLDVPAAADATALIADRDQLDAGLRRLTPDARALVVLHFYVGLSVPEAAAALEIPIGTAKSRLHRALAALRVTLSTTGPTPATRPGGQLA
jgi:RNA polymerase sigma-70 factor (ECF subfamily)